MPSPIGTALTRRLIAACTCLALSGCSFVNVQRARPPAEVEDPRVLETCTTTSEAPAADTVLAGVGLIGGYAWMIYSLMPAPNCTETYSSTCSSRGNPLPGLGAMVAGGVFVGSAIYGYVSTARCRRHIVAERRCASGDLWTCQKLSPGWRPPAAWRAPGALLEPVPGSTMPGPIPPPWNAQRAAPGGAPAAPVTPPPPDAR